MGAVIIALPLVFCVPDQLPEAVQLAVLIEDHVSVALPPSVTEAGEKDREGSPGGSSFSAASAWMNPKPELKLGVAPPMARAL